MKRYILIDTYMNIRSQYNMIRGLFDTNCDLYNSIGIVCTISKQSGFENPIKSWAYISRITRSTMH